MHAIKSKVLLKADKCLVMQPELIKIAGKSAALLLQQIHYWIENKLVPGKIYQQKKWIANSYEAWASDLRVVSSSTVKRSIKILKSLGLLSVEKLSDYKSNRTNWYTINYECLEGFLDIPISDKEGVNRKISFACDGKDRRSKEVNLTPCLDQNDPMYIDKKTKKENLIYLYKSEPSEYIKKNIQLIEKPLSQQMVDIWNETVDPSIKPELTKNRCKLLIAALKLKFSNNIQEWKSYCSKIASSDFLMGKLRDGFKVALDTALKFDFIQKISEKQFGVKDIYIPIISNDELIQEVYSQNISFEIKKMKLKILEKLGKATYVSWFKDAQISKTSETIEIITESIFKRDWIQNHYQKEIESLLGFHALIIVK